MNNIGTQSRYLFFSKKSVPDIFLKAYLILKFRGLALRISYHSVPRFELAFHHKSLIDQEHVLISLFA